MRLPELQTSLANEKLCSVNDSTTIHLIGRGELVYNGKEKAVNSRHVALAIDINNNDEMVIKLILRS